MDLNTKRRGASDSRWCGWGLLGGFKVSVGSRIIGGDGWRLRKAAALVKLLALAPGHRLHREQVMEAARKVRPDHTGSRYLESEDESLVLCSGGDPWVNVDVFKEAAVTGCCFQEGLTYLHK